jgi:endoglucanase
VLTRIPRPLRRLAPVFAASVVAVAAAGVWLGGGSASAGSLSGTLYRDPDSNVVRWVAANGGDSRAGVIRTNIASQPQARWFANFNLSTAQQEASSFVGAANAAGQVPVMSVYMIPNRDCGGASAGGAPDFNQYQTWVSNFSRGLGNRLAVIVLETDSIALQTCLGQQELSSRNAALSTAVRTIKSANPNAKVYLDGGHSAWNSASEQANRLRAAGVQYADGFYTNVSNFQPTSSEANYGRQIISALAGAGVGGKRQIIDTSRNGGAAGDWCADDNTDRRIGRYPTLNTGDANIDGYLWIKPPGEADGCGFQAGSFQPQLAFSLANGVAPPQDIPSSPAGSSSSSPDTPPGACSATYRIDSQWNTGFGATVTVRAGNTAIAGWTVRWTFANGQTVTQMWNGTDSPSGATHAVRNVAHNGSLGVGATTTFGFNGTWTGTNSVPTLTCTSP